MTAERDALAVLNELVSLYHGDNFHEGHAVAAWAAARAVLAAPAQPDDVDALIASLTKECKATDAGCPECARDRKLAADALRRERADRDRLSAEVDVFRACMNLAQHNAEKAEAEVERLRKIITAADARRAKSRDTDEEWMWDDYDALRAGEGK